MSVSGRTKVTQEPTVSARIKESQECAEISGENLSAVYQLSRAAKSSNPQFSQELKAKRPPVKKYIRKAGLPGYQKMVAEVVEQKPREISIASLKEKFGLSESRIGGIIRDAEKLGKIRRSLNGSYALTQD